MELEIIKYLIKEQKQERSYHPIITYKPLPFNNSLLIVSDGEMDIDGLKREFYQIFKVQSITSCTISITNNPLLIAFYIGEGGELFPYILSGLPANYWTKEILPRKRRVIY